MFRTVVTLGLAAILIVFTSSGAVASGFGKRDHRSWKRDHGSWKRDHGSGKRDFHEFIDCAFTKKVKVDETIYGVTETNPDFAPLFTNLNLALETAGLDVVLDGEGPFTVYAPPDPAFEALPPALLGFLLANKPDLTSVLTLHVSSGVGPKLDPRRTLSPREVPTLQPDGQTVFYNRGESGPQVNQSNVSCTPVEASNGVIYVIDSVLMPQYLP